MPSTAKNLGTTAEDLAAMTREDQMVYVEKYFKSYGHTTLSSVADLYTVMFYNKNFGKPVICSSTSSDPQEAQAYSWNKVLDFDHDGDITPEDLDAWAHEQTKGAAFQALLTRLAAVDPSGPAPASP
jgi:galactokinase/mevalonate kinase-like predicted kinase